MEDKPILQMIDITKVYPNGVVANQEANLTCQSSEIHALLGENGAGKSTLMNILFGAQQPTSGKILLNGVETVIKSPMHAIELGIGMVHQHFMLDDALTVTENIILGIEPKKCLAIDFKKADEMVREVAAKYNFQVDPDDLIMDLDVGKKQKVEILKALIRGAKILIMDEPTAVLTPQETEELFDQLKKLRENGHTIIFISHKLNEIKEICDRATIMRDGKYIGSFDVADTSIEEMSQRMIGKEIKREIMKTDVASGETVLVVEDIHVLNDEFKKVVDGVSFRIRAGEILGVAGVEGNGQRELIDCITGLETDYDGKVILDGFEAPKTIGAVDALRDKKMFHIPEDRLTYGVVKDASITDNLISNRYDKPAFNKGVFLDQKKIDALAEELISSYNVKTDSKDTPVRMLSGGNMQKVVAAREMSEPMRVLVADQPTRGIDVGAATFIHDRIVALRDEGVAVLLTSADINEVMELSDSLIVFYEGKVSAYFADIKDVTVEELGLYMLGLKTMSPEEIGRVAS